MATNSTPRRGQVRILKVAGDWESYMKLVMIDERTEKNSDEFSRGLYLRYISRGALQGHQKRLVPRILLVGLAT